MSSTNGQPPLTRRQVRDLERAREAGAAITESISAESGSPKPSSVPVTAPTPVQQAPQQQPAPTSAMTPAPGSIVGPGGLTRRELRAQRQAAEPVDAAPVPLRAPQPSSAASQPGRNLSDALSYAADIEDGTPAPIVPPREAARASAPEAPRQQSVPVQPVPVRSVPVQSVPVQPPVPSAAAPASVDEVTHPGAQPTPTPRSAGRTVDAPVAAPVDDADFATTGGIRRRGGATAEPDAESTLAAATPPPTSTPTVFPFQLSGGAAAASLDSSAPAEAARVPAPSAAAPAPAGAGASSAAQPPAAVEVPISSTPEPSQQPAASRIPASVPEPSGYVPPTGHWSTQAERDDDEHSSVGSHFSGATGQHNAVVIGDDRLLDVTGALNATGEVIITGSIDLPRSLAATGSHSAQRIDGADIDRMLEEGDREQPESDATPVRASRAVSANTSTRAVVLTSQPKPSRLPMVATICVGVVVVVIVGLVVAGFVTGVL
ncbi:hypothetical protein EDF46_1899 [Frondihabitans sp. PhB188]|uniref:hypothetical protein n=1 Tax=Frondihabitans sp. PhB188 TaxID=2485200 RepID=UPI000FA20569|nr:hypothetical protein [Frondihabitans sp. PhB188]ROQ38272.1 hypothetical protein EDF46_1899 [Frondihabitans sp. PhB188]